MVMVMMVDMIVVLMTVINGDEYDGDDDDDDSGCGHFYEQLVSLQQCWCQSSLAGRGGDSGNCDHSSNSRRRRIAGLVMCDDR